MLSLPEPYRGAFADWDWWISLSDGYPSVNLQREASKYLAHQGAQRPGKRHTNYRQGFRNWVATQPRWDQREADRQAARSARR